MSDDISERVSRLIEQSGLSKQDFGTRIGIDGSKLSKSLAGRRRFSSSELAEIAELGGTTVDWLLTGTVRPVRNADGTTS